MIAEKEAGMIISQFEWWALVGVLAVLGSIVVFFLKSLLGKIGHIETILSKISTFISKQEEKNITQIEKDKAQDELIKSLTLKVDVMNDKIIEYGSSIKNNHNRLLKLEKE